MRSGQTLDITEVKYEMVEKIKIVDESYERPSIPAPMVREVEPDIMIKNIWATLEQRRTNKERKGRERIRVMINVPLKR